jgi:hypothetical protein
VIQQKAATYEGSGAQAEEEAAVAKHKRAPPKPATPDPLMAVQQQSEVELRQADKQVETTETAQQATAALGGAASPKPAEDASKTPTKGEGMLAETDAANGSKL